MNKVISMVIGAIVMVNSLVPSAGCKDIVHIPSIDNGYEYSSTEEDVMCIDESDAGILFESDTLREYISTGGILVIKNEEEVTVDMVTILELPVSFAADLQNETENNGMEKDYIHVATIYYQYGDGLSGTCVINSTTLDGIDEDIDDAIKDIKDFQRESRTMNAEFQSMNRSSSYTSRSLGVLELRNIKKPKGQFHAKYEVLTVQEYNDRDYYIVKAMYNGYPGSMLGETDSQYDTRFQGESMNVTLGTSTSGVDVDKYGPETTNHSSTYSVEIGGSFSGDIINAWGLSYSRSRDDKEITVTGTGKQRVWDVSLSWIGNTQKVLCTFEPGITFVCPSNKTSIVIDVAGEYEVDAVFTETDFITLSDSIVCTPTYCDFQ